MNILLLTSHSIAEYDDLRMFTDLGYDVYSIGGAYDEVPFEGKRPALPNVKRFPELEAATNRQRARLTEERGDADQRANGGAFYVDWGKADLAPEVVDWLDVAIIHHFPEAWLRYNWPKLRGKRVIWRTCGQSDPRLETTMAEYHRDGVEIVRYSPAEERAFHPLGMWAGQDTLIRFGKYPADYQPFESDYPFYVGDWPVIGNITQDMKNRGEACGYDRWLLDTGHMLTKPAGPGSELLQGGMGPLSYEDMLTYLRRIRCYLYLGTQPASYTLGLIEAMLSGVPVVTHPWRVPDLDWKWLSDLWEGGEIVGDDRVVLDRALRLRIYLDSVDTARADGQRGRERAIELFDVATVGRQWVDFLGAPTTVTYEKATAA